MPAGHAEGRVVVSGGLPFVPTSTLERTLRALDRSPRLFRSLRLALRAELILRMTEADARGARVVPLRRGRGVA